MPNEHESLSAEQVALGYRGIPETVNVMLYELGMVSKNLIYSEVPGISEEDKRGYQANALLELTDLLCQAGILRLKILMVSPHLAYQPQNLDELANDGYERQIERMQEIQEKNNV